ncbi:hypothetical protein HZC34_05875 [Candidatus Saganbacteria bacterium]|nr:hypothetical protein [Candidatus Saganbacteria bacterium]
MENSPWRILFIATGASLLLLLFVYFLILPKSEKSQGTVEKIAVFKNTRVSGRENGKKAWEFSAKSGWAEKDNQMTYLENVTHGILYKDGKIITKNLTAPKVKANPSTKVIEAFAENKKQIKAHISFRQRDKDKDNDRNFASIRADFLAYDPNAKKTSLNGNIKIREKEISLSSDSMEIDNEKETSDFAGNVSIDRKDVFLRCRLLHYDSNEEKLNAEDGVRSIIKGKQKTYLNSKKMSLYSDDKKDVEASGLIEVVQGKKSAVANEGNYNKETEKILLKGDVRAVITKGRALLKEGTIKKLKNPDAKTLLEEKTFITSDTLTMSTINGDAKADGNVVVHQKGREAKADSADYSDSTETIMMVDNVYLKKDKDWIKSKKIIISVKNETFDAIGSVEAEFKIKK